MISGPTKTFDWRTASVTSISLAGWAPQRDSAIRREPSVEQARTRRPRRGERDKPGRDVRSDQGHHRTQVVMGPAPTPSHRGLVSAVPQRPSRG